MTWKSHILFAGTLAFALRFSPPEVLCISALSTLPDRMESIGPLRILRHRGISHDLALWIFLLLLALLLEVRGIVPRAVLDAGTLPVRGFRSLSILLTPRRRPSRSRSASFPMGGGPRPHVSSSAHWLTTWANFPQSRVRITPPRDIPSIRPDLWRDSLRTIHGGRTCAKS